MLLQLKLTTNITLFPGESCFRRMGDLVKLFTPTKLPSDIVPS